MRFASDRINNIGSSLAATPPPVSSFSTQPTAFSGSTFNSSFDTSNLAGDLGIEQAQTASVTISPLGNNKFRVYEKNDGDPSVYTAVDKDKPQIRTHVRTQEIRGTDDGGLAYPRDSGFGVGLQKAAGKYTKDGDHFADAFEADATAYSVPAAELYTGGWTQTPNSREQIANLDEYDTQYFDWNERYKGGKFKAGTNSFVLDSEDPEDLKKLSYYFGTD